MEAMVSEYLKIQKLYHLEFFNSTINYPPLYQQFIYLFPLQYDLFTLSYFKVPLNESLFS